MLKRIRSKLGSLKRNIRFLLNNIQLAGRRKIIYALTPSSALANVGDQAQVVAIRKWLKEHFPEFPVLEVDKGNVHAAMRALRLLVRRNDIIMLHSGGNMMDRAPGSEYGRRSMIQTFPRHSIISLPQTIYFSDTEKGRAEKQKTVDIYNRHPNLTIVARDRTSRALAEDMFPNSQLFTVPDFVLSLDGCYSFSPDPDRSEKVLLCLRRDTQSLLDEKAYAAFHQHIPFETEYYDTKLNQKFDLTKREEVLKQVLNYFAGFKAVVTDRFHGTIFAYLTRRPCVIYPTIDHKLISGVDWFAKADFIKLASGTEDLGEKLEEVLGSKRESTQDWDTDYFSPLAVELRAQLGLDNSFREDAHEK